MSATFSPTMPSAGLIPSLSINDISVTPPATGTTGAPATFTVALSAAVSAPVVVQYATVEGTASAGAGDYVGVPEASITLPAGQTHGAITIDVHPIDISSPTFHNVSKTFTVSIRSASGVSVAKGTGTATIVPPSSPPAIVVGKTPRVIQPGENLVAVLNAATTNQPFKLVAGRSYSASAQQVAPKVTGWSLDATGATVNWTIPPSVATACFRLGYNGVKITGGTWKTNAVVVEILAQACQFTNAVIPDGATQAVKIDAFNGNSGAGALVQGLTVGITSSVSIYCTQPCTIKANTLAASVGEVPLRIDCTSDGVSPADVIIDGNTIHSIAGTNQKGAVELRQLGAGCQFINNTLYDYMRVGQGSANVANQFANGLLIAGNKWPALPPTIQEHLMLMAGCTATVENNDWTANAIMETATVSGPTKIIFIGNRRHPSGPGITLRPQIWNPTTVPASGSAVDGGGNMVMGFGAVFGQLTK